MNKNGKSLPLTEIPSETLQKEALFHGMRTSLFTVASVAILAVLFFSKPYVMESWMIPFLYPLLRDGITWPIRAIALIWYILMLAAGYWFLDKRRRMNEAQAELERRQSKESTPQP